MTSTNTDLASQALDPAASEPVRRRALWSLASTDEAEGETVLIQMAADESIPLSLQKEVGRAIAELAFGNHTLPKVPWRKITEAADEAFDARVGELQRAAADTTG